MKSDKTLKQRIHDYWYVEPYQCKKEGFIGNTGIFYEDNYKDIQESFNKKAKEEQTRNRMLVICTLLVIPLIICTILYLFQIVLCIGLFLGLVGMLLK